MLSKEKSKPQFKSLDFSLRIFGKLLALGCFFSFWAPTYSGGDELSGKRSAMDMSELGYFELVIMTALVYVIFCFLARFTWKFQDKKKLKRLRKRKGELEREIKLN
ncbi:hypothetical protein [Aquimarina spongiae]|uniref:Uncharacterized protein n=1 Tax=Aquimarina spongiae TaxID=570521 RepID=A0A1M6I0W7_9FLAO|nr:hypothetical protein [Aquimarina spongiae]SHJ28132.1 hypothetical protein SAMN04488508_10746 [Aquimarina spongiae]